MRADHLPGLPTQERCEKRRYREGLRLLLGRRLRFGLRDHSLKRRFSQGLGSLHRNREIPLYSLAGPKGHGWGRTLGEGLALPGQLNESPLPDEAPLLSCNLIEHVLTSDFSL